MNNKLISFFIISIVLFFLAFYVTPLSYSATPTPVNTLKTKSTTPTPTEEPEPTSKTSPTDSVEIEKIQKIKDIVASKVAELDLVEKRGIIGKIKENKNMHIVVTDIKGKSRNIDVDELTNFSIGDKDEKSLGVSDLKEGVTYSFVGLYNKDTERLLVRVITKAESIPDFFEGAIQEINADEFQIVIVDSKGTKKTIDIQKTTKTTLSKADGEVEKSGFTKLTIGQRVIVAGFKGLKDENIVAATRVIHFEEVPPSKDMKQFVNGSSNSMLKTGESN